MVATVSLEDSLVLDSFIVVSDDLRHDSTAVFVFFTRFFQHIEEKYPQVKTIHVWSDGCASQYKSKLPFFPGAGTFAQLRSWTSLENGQHCVLKNGSLRRLMVNGLS